MNILEMLDNWSPDLFSSGDYWTGFCVKAESKVVNFKQL